MTIRILGAAAIATLTAGALAAQTDSFTQGVLETFEAEGFTHIEIKNGPTQVKVEGLRGTTKYEVIYDRDSGRILKQETERADDDDLDDRGIEIETEDRDFVRTASAVGRGDDDDRRSGRDDDDDGDDDRRSGRDDDDDDDDNRSDRGNDDDDDDDDDRDDDEDDDDDDDD